MTWCGEFFSQFRSFAAVLDRDCNELKSKIENDEISSDGEGRSHLILREILEDTQKLKEEALLKSSEVNRQSCSFGEFLSVCERLAEHTKTQIENFEKYLTKYGYKSPGELPSVNRFYTDGCKDKNNASTFMETDDTDGSYDNSQSEDDVDAMETEGISSESGCDTQGQVQDDLMLTPVKPDTYTPMIQATPPPSSKKTGGTLGVQCTPEQSPVPPQTTTPMLKHRPGLQNSDYGVLSPSSFDMPPQPVTYTPLIKAKKSSEIERSFTPTQIDNSPLPPVLYTPGIRMIGVLAQQEDAILPNHCSVNLPNEFGTPTLPDLTCTTLLKPGELEDHKQYIANTEMVSLEHFTLLPVSDDEYMTLPVYIRTQFSASDINELLLHIEEYLKLQAKETSRKTVKENVLEDLCLGRKTKTFMLAMKKLGRAEVKNGELIFNI